MQENVSCDSFNYLFDYMKLQVYTFQCEPVYPAILNIEKQQNSRFERLEAGYVNEVSQLSSNPPENWWTKCFRFLGLRYPLI